MHSGLSTGILGLLLRSFSISAFFIANCIEITWFSHKYDIIIRARLREIAHPRYFLFYEDEEHYSLQ